MVGVVGSSPIAPTNKKEAGTRSGFFISEGVWHAVIRLPDGSERVFEAPVTVAEVAASIGAGLARAALAGKVDGSWSILRIASSRIFIWPSSPTRMPMASI
jgi:hypothetical protein